MQFPTLQLIMGPIKIIRDRRVCVTLVSFLSEVEHIKKETTQRTFIVLVYFRLWYTFMC